jgi:hypothetical protein
MMTIREQTTCLIQILICLENKFYSDIESEQSNRYLRFVVLELVDKFRLALC